MLKNGFHGVDPIIREVVYKPIDGTLYCEVGMVIMVPTSKGYRLGVSKYNHNREITDHIPFSQATGYDLAYEASKSDIIITLPDFITKGGITFRSREIVRKIDELCHGKFPINVQVRSTIKHFIRSKNDILFPYLKLSAENTTLRNKIKEIKRNYSRLGVSIKKSLRNINDSI